MVEPPRSGCGFAGSCQTKPGAPQQFIPAIIKKTKHKLTHLRAHGPQSLNATQKTFLVTTLPLFPKLNINHKYPAWSLGLHNSQFQCALPNTSIFFARHNLRSFQGRHPTKGWAIKDLTSIAPRERGRIEIPIERMMENLRGDVNKLTKHPPNTG